MTRPARHPRQILRIREAILDAAIAVFARKGFQAATMHEIAREAGYTAPSLYNYFPGKRQIFEALVDRLDEEYITVFAEPMPPGLGFEAQVEILVKRQLEVTRRRRGAFKIFMALQGGAGTIPSASAARRHADGFRTYMARFAAWMDAAAAGTDVGGRSGEALAYSLWGLSMAFQARAAATPASARAERASRAAEEEAEVQALLAMFLLGARGAPR
jgi:AcrR family transcriptional regulator